MPRLKKEDQERLKEYARLLYTEKGISIHKELSEKVGVRVQTISKWIKEGDWEKWRKNLILTRDEQMRIMLEQLSQINKSIAEKPEGERFPDYKQSMIRRNIIKDIKELETKALVAEYINSFINLIDYVRGKSLDDARFIARHCDRFIKEKLRDGTGSGR